MQRVMLENVANHLGQELLVKGWVSKVRNLGSIIFVILRDRSGTIQLVMENVGSVTLRSEDVIAAKGKVVTADHAPDGFEIHVDNYEVISKARYDMMPFNINRAELNVGLDIILDNRVLSLRNEQIAAIFKVQHHIVTAFREFFTEKEFLEIQTPKIVASGTEGAQSFLQ